jgi:2-hydroxychromene-2-carboxylate isomerase
LRAHTDAAIAHGVFGVPALEVDGQLFWGFDALPMLRDCMVERKDFHDVNPEPRVSI